MPSVWVVKRTLDSGKRRWVVRFRVQKGAKKPVYYGGSFKTEREAKARVRWIGGEIAAGRFPDIDAHLSAQAPKHALTVPNAAEKWLAAQVQYRASSKRTVSAALPHFAHFGKRLTTELTHRDVQEWVGHLHAEEHASHSIRNYKGFLALVLDYFDVEPNPARDKRVRIPKTEAKIPNPPSAADVRRLADAIIPQHRLAVLVLEATGMRIGELVSLTWGDVAVADSRWRVASGKTAAARRWVQVPESLMAEVLDLCPFEDRVAERRVFPTTTNAIRDAMARACKAAGIQHIAPHDLRRRRISQWHKEGVPFREIAARVGHSHTSITSDTYTFVLSEEESSTTRVDPFREIQGAAPHGLRGSETDWLIAEVDRLREALNSRLNPRDVVNH